MLEAKEHSSLEGLLKIIGIKSALNLGLSESLVNSFPGIEPVARPEVTLREIVDPN
jgi:hypothetical protein